MVASLGVRRLALLGGLAAGVHASALIWPKTDNEGLHYATRDVNSVVERNLQQRADAALCGYIDGEALNCRSGQVCSVDHGNQVIGCCPKNNPRCSIAQSCGNEGSFGGFFGRDKRDSKVLTCGSGFFAPSCYAYSYSGGPYDGYNMYACLSDTFFAPVQISMNQQLDTDDQPITTTKPPTTTTTTRPPQTTNQSTRPTTSRPPVQTSKNDGITTTTDPAATTTDSASSPTATDANGVSTSTISSSPSATAVSGAVDGSTVPGGTNTGAIVGGVLGGIAFILLCIAAVMYFLWWRKKRSEESTYNPSMAYSGNNSGFNQERSGSALRGNIPSHPNMKGNAPWTFSQYSPGGAAYGAGAGAAAGAGVTGAAVASNSWFGRHSHAPSQDPGHGYYGKTADDTGVSPISSSVSPPDSPIQGSRSPPRPVSPQQTYSRHNPPPPEQFRAYQPYEGT